MGSTNHRIAWLTVVPGARSLHRQLFIALLLPQLVLWIAAAVFTYKLAARYANEAIDASLLQASKALSRQVKPIASGLFIDFPRSAQDILESDPSDRVLYTVSTPPGKFIMGNKSLPLPPSTVLSAIGVPYFYDGSSLEPSSDGLNSEQLRIVALPLEYKEEGAPIGTMLVQVARSRANREDLARRILIDTVLPLSAVIAAMTLIVWAGIRSGLAPLKLLQRHVEGRAANDLTPIQLEASPPEVRALAGAINTLLAEVHRNVIVQKQFISDAAHQLRTPLAGLKSQTDLALKEATDPQLIARLKHVNESATRSAHLVAQLLTLARAEPESSNAQHRVLVNMDKLAREVTASLVPRALHAGVDLGFDVADTSSNLLDNSTLVMGTPLLLREALVNLVDNSIRYAGSGANVTVRVRHTDSAVELEVEDNGPGLPETELEHVFERFVRATHDGSGCGLGLAIVKEIVERHLGKVKLQNLQPKGLIATVSLPIASLGERR